MDPKTVEGLDFILEADLEELEERIAPEWWGFQTVFPF
jgi:hypothetical protein